MMELEEKRLRMEERQLEREAQQCKEERDFPSITNDEARDGPQCQSL